MREYNFYLKDILNAINKNLSEDKLLINGVKIIC